MLDTQKNFHKKLLGSIGEKRAVNYLKEKGYTILKTNYKTHIGEADIIAKDGDYIVFIEVKTRSSDRFGLPSEAVGRDKQKKYEYVANEYLLKNKLLDSPVRFDVIEVLDDKINHILDAFCV